MKILIIDKGPNPVTIDRITNKLKFIGGSPVFYDIRDAVIETIYNKDLKMWENLTDKEQAEARTTILIDIFSKAKECDAFLMHGSDSYDINTSVRNLCLWAKLKEYKMEEIEDLIIERIASGKYFPAGEEPETPPIEPEEPPTEENPSDPEGGDENGNEGEGGTKEQELSLERSETLQDEC